MSGSFCYPASGIALAADRAIPGLAPLEHPTAADTRVWFEAEWPAAALGASEQPWYSSPFLESGVPAVRVWKLAAGAFFKWRYSDGTEFLVDRTGSGVWASWPPSSSLEDTATYLLGPILGFVLRLRGVTCLHASAVAVDGRAVAFVGPAYAGKSTTAAAFSRLGHPVIADDIVALVDESGTPRVQPAFPQVRLWPESVEFLYGTVDALPRLAPNWEKRCLDLSTEGSTFAEGPLPLAAVYVLGARGSHAGASAVGSMPGAEALLTLVANTHVNYLDDAPSRAREFNSLGRIVATVPVKKAFPPADPAGLPRFCDRIVDDVQHR